MMMMMTTATIKNQQRARYFSCKECSLKSELLFSSSISFSRVSSVLPGQCLHGTMKDAWTASSILIHPSHLFRYRGTCGTGGAYKSTAT